MTKQSNIGYIKSFDSKKFLNTLGKESQITYKELKDDTEDFTDFSVLDMYPEMEQTLDVWVQTVELVLGKQGVKMVPVIEPKFKVRQLVMYKSDEVRITKVTYKPESIVYVYNYKSEDERIQGFANEEYFKAINKVVKPAKSTAARKATDTPKPDQNANKKKTQLDTLEAEFAKLKTVVAANAKFKDKIGFEMIQHLKTQGLSGKRVEDMNVEEKIKRVQEKIKFYKNLLKGDKADFKAIGKRIGLDYRKSTPRAKKVAQAQAGLGKPKPKNRPARKPKTIFQKISNWFNS